MMPNDLPQDVVADLKRRIDEALAQLPNDLDAETIGVLVDDLACELAIDYATTQVPRPSGLLDARTIGAGIGAVLGRAATGGSIGYYIGAYGGCMIFPASAEVDHGEKQ